LLNADENKFLKITITVHTLRYDLSSSSISSSTSTSSSLTDGNTVNYELLDFESDDEETIDQTKPLNWAE